MVGNTRDGAEADAVTTRMRIGNGGKRRRRGNVRAKA